MKPILEIQGISKRFRINHETQPYLSLRESLSGWMRRSPAVSEDFWALRDISFDVQRGESVGVIGKNGAGKSTLLKILSRITPPTRGRILVRGRVASLLEVGTGFHPELTGRENVYLNGSMLGMRKQEIDRQFDAIVAFAGTEKFLDTPLKHYSSGMQLRLAFAVAAFLEPEILIIDEVLAVGDAEFQRKCLGKMEDVTRSGRTILFVSHNMSAITRMCSRALWIDQGKLAYSGPSEETVRHYLGSSATDATDPAGFIVMPESHQGPVQRIELLCDGNVTGTLYMGCQMEVRVYFQSKEPLDSPILGLIVKDSQQSPLIGVNNKHYSGAMTEKSLRAGYLSARIPRLPLFEGQYSLDVHFGNGFHDLEVLRDCIRFAVEPAAFTSSGLLPDKEINRVFIDNVTWSAHPTDIPS
ncbi:MAG: ABC transporter ATP-binding protein [Cyclobacteriaceae bacterium]|nr:ABC transporter ATP-binding protein [Cyclobacteriaceae bacterium]